MKDHTVQYERQQQVSREQDRQKLANCALLCAYVFGQPGGWYVIADGNIDGFNSDYALIHSNPGDLCCHHVRAIYAESDATAKEYADEIEEIRTAVAKEIHMEELPLVAVLTADEIELARKAVMEALAEEQPADVEQWLRGLCSGGSELSMCDWDAVVDAARAAIARATTWGNAS